MSDDPIQQPGRPDGGDDTTPTVADPSPPADSGSTPQEPAVPQEGAAGEAGTTPEGVPVDGASDGEDFTPEQIDALVAERDEFLDAYRRTAADFENFRKQSHKRLADEVTRAQGSFVERLLPVLDAIDAARLQGSDHVEAVAGPLFGFLEKEGLQRVDPANEPFDPNVSEAVVHEPGDPDSPSAEPIVSEVLRTGYLWQGRVIRPAMVKVSG